MKTVYKFTLELQPNQFLSMPEGAEILSAQTDHEYKLCLWALIDLNKQQHSFREIAICADGNPVPDNSTFIANAKLASGHTVHIFETTNY